jgi:YHYH protein
MKRIKIIFASTVIVLILLVNGNGGVIRAGQTSSGADLTRLPVGDGRISSAPQDGYVWACNSAFGGGGAFLDGPWILPRGTFDLTAKPAVQGTVAWPSQFSLGLAAGVRTVTGNDLPDHPTGVFPISPEDEAYNYDRDPNAIAPRPVRLALPAVPTMAASASCLTMGPIGVLLTGSFLFNALDAGGRDALAHEIQDACDGHPAPGGMYHYHSLTPCLDDSPSGHSALAGYALDGFGIYGPRGEHGEILTNSDLDECHGHIHVIDWDGQPMEMYHYHATLEYPYTLGCFRGTPLRIGPANPLP